MLFPHRPQPVFTNNRRQSSTVSRVPYTTTGTAIHIPIMLTRTTRIPTRGHRSDLASGSASGMTDTIFTMDMPFTMDTLFTMDRHSRTAVEDSRRIAVAEWRMAVVEWRIAVVEWRIAVV